MRVIVLCGCLVLLGCLDEVSPAKQLNEAVTEMNKATRWGQLGTAAQMVEPSYRAQFADKHSHWGAQVQVADFEIMHVEMQPGDEVALAVIAYQWYEMNAMTLHQTVVRQRWSRVDGGYTLISESVIQGDDRIFKRAEDTSGGEDAPAQLMSDPLMGSAGG